MTVGYVSKRNIKKELKKNLGKNIDYDFSIKNIKIRER